MPIIRKNELRSLNKQELNERLTQLEFEILKVKSKGGQTTTGTKRVREIKRTIARIHAQLNNLE